MAIINRLALLIFTAISIVVLILLAIMNTRWYAIYLAYTTEKVYNFLYGKKEGKI